MEHPVRVARKAKSMTQADLATAAGISSPMVSRIENGQPATMKTFRSLAKALGIADYRQLMPEATS